MLRNHDREKLINAIVYFAQNTRYCGKTKLIKLLYFLDFNHYRDTGRSVTNLEYYAWQMGPVPTALYDEIGSAFEPDLASKVREKIIPTKHGNSFQLFQPVGEFESQHFSKREMQLLQSLAEEYKDSKSDEMIEATHLENLPWSQVYDIEKNIRGLIPYKYAIRKSECEIMSSIARENDEIKHNYQ
jgi:uncharacterized phage-associated protein